MDLLEKHMALGHTAYLFKVKDPYVVASYFKFVIKCMAEPLCTFKLYPEFRDLPEIKESKAGGVDESKEAPAVASRLRDLIWRLPALNRNTLGFILAFFQ